MNGNKKIFFCKFFFVRILVLAGFFGMAACLENGKAPAAPLPLPLSVEESFLFTYPYENAEHEDRFRARNRILERIRLAKSRIDLWCYGFDERQLGLALLEAKRRKIQIRIIGSPEEDYPLFRELGLSVERRRKSGLQHAKLMLIDDAWLISGTGNFTRSGFFYNNNVFFILPVSKEKAASIRQALLREGQTKSRIRLSAWNAELLVSPGDGRIIQSLLLSSILRAKQHLQFLVFSHSDPMITSALRLAAAKGRLIEGIYNDNNNDGQIDLTNQKTTSEAQILNSSLGLGLSQIYLEGNRRVFPKKDASGNTILHGGKLHHKTLIVDGQRVLTGSYNWSLSARDQNLEAFFFFANSQVARVFQKEFERIRKRAVLVARPPFPAEFLAKPRLRYEKANDRLCADGLSPSPAHRIAIFSGTGACFRAWLFALPTASSCIPAASFETASAGLAASRDYGFGDIQIQNSRQDFFPGPSLGGELGETNPVCRGDGFFVHQIRSFGVSENVAWIANPPDRPYSQIQIWGRQGLSDWLPVISRSREVLEIPQSDPLGTGKAQNAYQGGDAIFFLRNANNALGIFCLQSGSTLNANLRAFQRGLLRQSGQFLECRKL